MVITLMTLPYRAMSTASYATLNQAYIDNDIVKVKDLFSRSGINILVVATGIFIITICNLDNLISLCNFPPGYDIIKPIIVILLIGRLFDMATGLNNELISISKYYKFNFRVAILLLIMVVVFDYILIPKYSVNGAAWGATASLIIFNIIKVIYLWVKMRLQPFNSKTGLIIIAGATAGIIGYLIPFVENDLIDLIIRTGVIFVIYLTLLLVFRASDDLTTYLKSVKNTRRLF
jgi:O-antigen/teichoic acid export membrane protein